MEFTEKCTKLIERDFLEVVLVKKPLLAKLATENATKIFEKLYILINWDPGARNLLTDLGFNDKSLKKITINKYLYVANFKQFFVQ